MPAQLRIDCLDPGWLFGVGTIELVIDGQPAAALMFGSASTISVEADEHTAQIFLRGVLTRQSNVMRFACADGEALAFTAKYSKLWGNMRIARA